MRRSAQERADESITTHIFSPGCSYQHSDMVFEVKESPIADYRQVDEPEQAAKLDLPNPFWALDWGFVLAR